MQILDDLYTETKRLFIAGSKFAKGDPRVSKHIPVLEKMGERAPVMKTLAEKYMTLVNSGQPETLMDAGTFLYAVRATQGETEVSGKTVYTAPSIYELPKTATPYSSLKPVLDALALSKQGRFEVVKSAFAKGFFSDFRLFGPLVTGLDDKYSELADYVYTTVIPSVGAPIIPYILEQYDPSGKRGDAMRLSLLDKLGYENAEQLAYDATEKGDPLVAIEGIKILGLNPENEGYLLTLAADRKADIREAALCGLMRMDSAQGKELMLKTLKSGKYKSAVQAAKICKDPKYTRELFDLVRPRYDSLFEKDLPDTDFVKSNQAFVELFGVLENKDDSAVYAFFTGILTNKAYFKRLKQNNIYFNQSGDARRLVCEYLDKCPVEKAAKVFEESVTPEMTKDSQYIAVHYYHTAAKLYAPERIFDVFSPYVVSGQLSFDQMFFSNSLYLYAYQPQLYTRHSETELERIRSAIDPRWKKLAVHRKDIQAISVLICEDDEHEQGMKRAILEYAKDCAAKAKERELVSLGYAICRLAETTNKKKSGLFKGELEKAADICYGIFEQIDGSKAAYFYNAITKDGLCKLFYPEYAEKFKALAIQKTSSVFKQIIETFEAAAKIDQ